MHEREGFRNAGVAQSAEPAAVAQRLLLEPRAHDVNEQAIYQARQYEFLTVALVARFEPEQLLHQLQLRMPFGFARTYMNEPRQNRKQRVWPDVLESVLGAKHSGGVARTFGQLCQSTLHLLVDLEERLGAMLWSVAKRVRGATRQQDDVAVGEQGRRPLAAQFQPATAALHDVHDGCRGYVDFDSPWNEVLVLADHDRTESRRGEHVRQNIHVLFSWSSRIGLWDKKSRQRRSWRSAFAP